VYDLTAPPDPGRRSLGAEVQAAIAGLERLPAVLDWTGRDVASLLPGLLVFRPPLGDALPYPDGTIDAVVVGGGHDVAEALRVASGPVFEVVEVPTGGVEVVAVHGGALAAADRPAEVVLWTPDVGDRAWQEAVAEEAAATGVRAHLAPLAADGLPDPGDAAVLVLVEPFVLPLPGAVESAVAAAVAEPSAAVAAKVLRADGRLESAGGTVFADRSVALVANGSVDVRGPWHDYVRPVCWSAGLLAVDAGTWRALTPPPGVDGRAFLRELGAELWGRGFGVRYHPSVAAVRVAGEAGEPSVPLESSAWQRVLDLRPRRPAQLDDGTWRHQLATDDVEACRR
jgi:hypothetical protein